MIPQEKADAVNRALREAFDTTHIEDIRRMTKGHTSALVYRIVVRGAPYLLRIIMYRNTLVGPERQFTCMRIASAAGIAPQVWYTSLEDQLSITDFVEEQPFSQAEALTRMPATLRSLHALPPFPAGVTQVDTTCMFLLHQGPAAEGFVQKFKSANQLPQSEAEELLRSFFQLSAVYPYLDAANMVSSHNDLFKPDNTLYDGNRVWLVDWEAAFLNDRYADLAVVANLVVGNDADEAAFLNEYFGRPADDYQRARFFLMRQLVHMFYTMAFLLLGSSQAGPASEETPEWEEFRTRMWAGDVNVADPATKILYGRVHWNRLAANIRHPRFANALKIVSEWRPTCSQ